MPRVARPTTEWVLTKKRLSVIPKKKDDKSRGFLKVLPNRLYEIQKVAQVIGITLLSYGLAGIKMLSCFFAVIIALSAALVLWYHSFICHEQNKSLAQPSAKFPLSEPHHSNKPRSHPSMLSKHVKRESTVVFTPAVITRTSRSIMVSKTKAL